VEKGQKNRLPILTTSNPDLYRCPKNTTFDFEKEKIHAFPILKPGVTARII